jgi:hypothetical protein
MLERVEYAGGMVVYQSPLLRERGVIHGFSTRVGGVSGGPYASLNLAALTKDELTDGNTHIAENFRRLRRALGVVQHMRAEVRQVHGGAVWRVAGRPMRPNDAPQADAMVTDDAKRLLAIRTADCAAVLMCGVGGKVVAAVHAGWRGVVAGVVPAAVAAMKEQWGIAGADVVAAIGPAIGVERFEVGAEVAEAFERAGLGEAVKSGRWARPHVDLAEAVAEQLVRAGVPGRAIDRTDRCTYEHGEEFFSHRRDHGVTGRMAAVIAARD